MDLNNTTKNPSSRRGSIIAISIITIIIAGIVFYMWYNHKATFITATSFEQEPVDSLIETEFIDTIPSDSIDSIAADSIDSIAADSLKTDSLNIDSINNAVEPNQESIFDTSKKEMKNRLLAIEKYLEETSQNYEKGKVSSKNARIASDSVSTVLDSITKEKNSKDFKHQIKAIKRKNNSLRESLGLTSSKDSTAITQ